MALAGQAFLVTGATDGVGRHTAQRLAAAGAAVLVHGRDPSRAAAAAAALPHAPGAPPHAALAADLSSLAAVRRLAAEARAALRGRRLAALVNNAGVFRERHALSAVGLEATWAVNVAAPCLLSALLLGELEAGGRVVYVASVSAASALGDFADVRAGAPGAPPPPPYSAHAAYARTKLANICVGAELAARLAAAGRDVVSSALGPGTANTKMLLAGWGRVGIEVGAADDEFWLAAAAEGGAPAAGRYFVGRRGRRRRRATPPRARRSGRSCGGRPAPSGTFE
jgi:NAD(P)-dependent dehydrogenase (short-subunit alcohol dehydrogenase family)